MADALNKNAAINDPKKKVTTTTGANLEKKRGMVDQRHRYLLDRFAEVLGEKSADLENSLLYGNKIEMMNDFFAANGAKKIIMFWQPHKDESLKTGAKNCLIVSDGTKEGVAGVCGYFIRTTTKAITTANIYTDIYFGMVNDILTSLRDTIRGVVLPALQAQENWGSLTKKKNGPIEEFMDSVGKFVDTLNMGMNSLKENIKLHHPSIDLSAYANPSEMIAAASNPDLVNTLESLVAEWCKQIEQVLAESEQMRKEADDIGPNAELAHWKSRMAKFNSITDQLKSQDCKTVVNILHASKSRLLKQWKDLDNRVTDAANESKDNVKYLYTLERFCEPLYRSDPVGMQPSLPGLINAIKMIYSISRYYNTSERMTSLFVKITNQMITSCKEYVYEDGEKLWEHDRQKLLTKLNDCLKLNEAYQRIFHETKKKLQENPNEKQFDFSEMYIFGKFDAFCKRIQKLVDLFDLIQKFSALSTLGVEGVDGLVKRFDQILNQIKRKPYDMLDHRKMEFDNDYAGFMKQIVDLEASLQQYIDNLFQNISSTERSLDLLEKFSLISNLQLDLESKYQAVFVHYCRRDLEAARKAYQKYKDNPPIARNIPSVAGSIAWARQLYRRIDRPMRLFQKSKTVLNTPDAKRHIKNFNMLASALIEFELLWHRSWKKAVDSAKLGLQATVLVADRDIGKVYVNFDPQILQLIKETKCIQRMGLEVPETAKFMCMKEQELKQAYMNLHYMLQTKTSLMAKIPPILLKSMGPHIEELDVALQAGLTSLSWTSLNLKSYLATIQQHLVRLEELLEKVLDITNCRINAGLDKIAETCLCEIPNEIEQWTIEELLDKTERRCKQTADSINRKSEMIEIAVKDLIGVMRKGVPEQRLTDMNSCYEDVFSYFNHRIVEVIVQCTRGSLDLVKNRLGSYSGGQYSKTQNQKPFFKAELVLSVPTVLVSPKLEDIQAALTKKANMILDVSKKVYIWGQNRGVQEENLKSFYSEISNNKDVIKVIMALNSTVSAMRKDVESFREQFNRLDYLWKDDRNEFITKFLAGNPSLHDFETEINKYEAFEKDIQEIQSFTQISSVLISAEPFKQALISETKAWKQQYGLNLNKKVKNDMEDMIEYMENKTVRLNRKIVDIDDIRQACQTLSEIRESEVNVDMKILPIEEAYHLLVKHNVAVSREETEMVDSLRYSWKKLKQLVLDSQSYLSKVQPNFKNELISTVQKFAVEVNEFTREYNEKGPMASTISPKTATERLIVFQRSFDEINRKWETYTAGEELFGLPVTPFPSLVRMKKELKLLQNLYGLYNAVLDKVHAWYDLLWTEVDFNGMTNTLTDFAARCRKLPKAIKDWEAFQDLNKMINDSVATVPLLELMSHKAIQQRHWDTIMDITKTKFNLDPDMFYLKNLMEAPLLKHAEEIEDICTAAVKEADIEIKLKAVVNDWSDKHFMFSQFKTRGFLVLKPSVTSEVITQMEDSLMMLGSLMSNRYNAPFKKDIQSWVAKLSTASEVIESWLSVQNLWIYLEAVFVGGDIAKQMPKEAKRFQNIDKSWCKIMARTYENPNVITCTVADDTLPNLLPHLTEQLELCQKSLSGYLEAKRSIFPRFYFVSDPALLEILGQSSDSHTIQAHLKSVFDNVQQVQFHDKEYDRILALESSEGEKISLSKPISASGNVEVWLGVLLQAMRTTVNDIIREAVMRMNEMTLQAFLNDYPAQVGLLCLQIMWTTVCEEALTNSKSDKKAMTAANQKISEILSTLIEFTTQDLSKMDRVKYETFITIQVHHKDVFEKLYKSHIKAPQDFEWLKQCRFYWKEVNDCCIVSITNFDFKYNCEYLGCTDRLVITPLTDRCYITLAQALGMSLGGSPAGPAGTGKTESVKDLGKALGKWVVVFNCSDQMDYRGLGRIFKGLAQSGAWGCFDEFNRIELPVLSVAAQQIGCVLAARRERRKSFVFTDGETIELSIEVGYFITMNPTYAGRVALPENLKTHFRYVAMMVPDRQIIIRVKLAGCGFQNNIVLARKFFVLYRLCEEQLSKQVHYDFGLRNILSVLRTSGAFKRANPEDSENLIIMRVLRDMNLSKLVDEDENLFLSLVNDLFPGLVAKKANYPEVEKAVEQQLQEASLVNHPPWTLKVIQLYETCKVRHGIMVLGPPGAGKTRCINTLMKAMTAVSDPHKEIRMNPKAITDYQMFGRLDVTTNDWTDGIFSALWRKTTKKKGEYLWIVLDGPVDAVWIENLNSVLDDNKCLTLANGDRIPMSPTCKLVFEVHSLDNASPATVSRCGMIYMGMAAMTWDIMLQSWLKTRPKNEAEILEPLFKSVFGASDQFVNLELHPKIDVPANNTITTVTNLLDGLIPPQENGKSVSADHIQRLFLFSLFWGVGALLELDERKKLQQFILDKNTDMLYPPISNDANDTVYEYFVDQNGEWVHWKQKVPQWSYPVDSKPEFSSIIVPTVDNVRMEFLISVMSKLGKAILLIGEPGTAKTVTVNRFLAKLDPDYHLNKRLNFSSATTPMIFQRTVESFLDKRMGSTYGPPAGKKMTLFIDDINMPEINIWNDQVTAEIVRQLMEYQGFYNLDKPGDWTSVVDLQFIGAMMHPGGGRNNIALRLKRHFNVFNCTIPSESSVERIFGNILIGFFSEKRGFNEEIRNVIPKLSSLTRKVWQATKIKLLPTPSKFHYIFNLRDLSRIVEGMLNSSSEVVPDVKTLMNLWEHECSRVLPDRFTNSEDFDWFNKTLVNTVNKELGPDFAKYVATRSYWADFLRDAPEVDENSEEEVEVPKVYEMIPSFDTLRERLLGFMRQFNETVRGGKMDLVLFEDAMKHILRISRIIRTPRGNALLVGVGGSGKQSLTKLASYIAQNQLFQITISKSYNTSNLMEDLKFLYKLAGLQGKAVTFIFTDNEIKEESFLEFINNILTSGEVSNLFQKDEILGIASDLRGTMKKVRPQVIDTNENLWQFFIDRVKSNLHIVLSFSPVGDKFRNRALKFPGLISGCTMDWFNRWPSDALRAVADKFLLEFDITCTPEVKKEVVNHMAFVHDLVTESCQNYFQQFRRRTHVTPKSYLSFINSYIGLYKQKRKEVGELSDRMNVGLAKLLEASKSVAVLKEQLVVKEKELVVASKNADAVLADVSASTASAEKVKESVLKVKLKSEQIANAIKADKDFAESQLEAAKPALEEATKALNSIQPAHISTIRKLAKPPHLIMRIMDGVLLLQKRKIDAVMLDPERPCPKPSWSESLRLMSQSDFLSSLINFPCDEINEETCELVEPYLEMPDFTLEGAKKVSADVAGLASWVRAMCFFYTINKKVIPLKNNLIVQERKLEIAMTDLSKAQKTLDEKQAELDILKAKYSEAITNKQTLQADADSCKRKMTAATALINGLKGEKDRWTLQSKEFAEQIGRLVGDVVLATAFLSYAGPFNQTFRQQIMNQWKEDLRKKKIPFSSDVDIISLLVDGTTIGEWNIQGLPTDELSTQNGIIVTKATRFPLLVDPQGQAKSWIRKREEKNGLIVTTLTNKYFRQHIEDCLSQGKPMLIEDIEETLDPTLDNILERNLIKSGRSFKVIFGDKEIDFSEGFCLFFTTKLANPRYSPEIYAKTSIVDFTVTQKGLEDQLLGRVIMKEKQELETERSKLLEEVNTNKKKMKELEDNLLQRLTSTQGSLVDDESLIEVLAVTKSTAEEVSEKLVIAADTQKKITVAREEYRPVASRGSILYFLIAEMSMISVMYQTSLRQFLGLFDESMAKSANSPIPSKRIQNIIEYCSLRTFKYCTRALYEEHKLLFTLLMAMKIDIFAGKVQFEEFRCFIKGGAALDVNAVVKKPFPWIPDMTWLNLVALSKLPAFQDIVNQVGKNEKGWKSWYEKDSPENEPLPGGFQNTIDSFRKLMLIRSWCLDRTIVTAKQYISDSLGAAYAESQILDLDNLLEESDCRTPLICLLSIGADPSADIEALSKKQKIDMKAISMGQGQEVHARKLLSNYMANGGWALLQNCHLGIPFLDELLSMILETEVIHEKFRCWITTDIHEKFPINLLQISIKFTNEPPRGIRAGLRRTYGWLTQDMLDVNTRPQYKPLLYAVGFLHTIVQERRKFGPLGWNVPYEFNQSDLAASVQFVQNHLDELQPKASISWATVRYMFCEVHYGGRVTDDYDRRLLVTYGKSWFGDHMFADTFAFYKGYSIPHLKTVDEYRKFIDELALFDTPEVFGLHPNADISCQTKESNRMLDDILSIQPKDSGTGSGETREDVVKRIANDLLSKLPEDFNKHKVKSAIQKLGGPKPLNIFLGQEVDRMQTVITKTRVILSDLKLAIDGTIIMSPVLQESLDALYDARVPPTWEKVSWKSATLGLWFAELVQRTQQFQSWLFDGKPNVFWLSGFFNPQGFLTAMRQEITRAHQGWALDNVKLHSDVLRQMKEDITQPPAEGVYIHGLFIEGAGWDRKNSRLIDSQPKIIYMQMPIVHLSAINSTDDRDPRFYQCPVYRRPNRTDLNYVFDVELKTAQNPDYWIIRGVAMLCSTS